MLEHYRYLSKINSPQDLRKLSLEELPALALELRDYILEVVSVKQGHLGASLGVTELSIALHYYLDTPQDLLLWDVGHQAYVHKILTGRKEAFENLRQKGEISGFPLRNESKYDVFGVGHSSTTISAITGMALADELNHLTRKHFTVIGDASIVSGMAMEGLNYLGDTGLDVCVILNDNNIGIDYATGALSHYFNHLNLRDDTFFRDLGFHYEGVVDGHSFKEIFNAFKSLEEIKGPKLLHVRTVKGKGYPQAETDQVLWHSPGVFDKNSGVRNVGKQVKTYPNVVGETLCKVLKENKKAVVISPAMLSGSSLMQLKQNYTNRVWDVGIAEQHAVTLAAGLASQGMTPFCVIYSTFLQRAYDQVIHDVALQSLPVVFLIDRAGLVGSDGATHQGYFDLAFMNTIPNMIVAAPMDAIELDILVRKAASMNQPVAIRYPKTQAQFFFTNPQVKLFKAKTIKKGDKIVVLSTGTIGHSVYEAINHVEKRAHQKIGWVHFPFVKPLDEVKLKEIFNQYTHVVTYEEGVKTGGFGLSCLEVANQMNWKGKMKIEAFPDQFIEHANIAEQKEELGFSVEGIIKTIQSFS